MSKLWAGLVVAAGLALESGSALAAGPSCFDGVQNGPESDVDCGGDCPACDKGLRCQRPRDCVTGRCSENACEERLYERGEAVPRGYRLETSTGDAAATARKAGILFFAVGYAAAYVTALALPQDVSWLYAPVLGPFVAMEDRTITVKVLLAVDGAFQSAGAALLIGGIAGQGQQLLRVDSARLRVVPQVARSGCGLGLAGAF